MTSLISSKCVMIRLFINVECFNDVSKVSFTTFYTIEQKWNLTRKGVMRRQYIQLVFRHQFSLACDV